MTSLRLQKRRENQARWSSSCRHRNCDRTLHVNAEPWQTKVEVLSELRYHPERKHGHLHGVVNVYGYSERGGE